LRARGSAIKIENAATDGMAQPELCPGGWHNYCGHFRFGSDFPKDLVKREINWGNKNWRIGAACALDRMSQSRTFIRERPGTARQDIKGLPGSFKSNVVA
jgi:hypothetical protein